MIGLENFSDIKILIIGDVMLDRYWWGSVTRISPEAPVPVVHLKDTSLVAGGAANVAANIAGLGAKPLLVGIVGNDSEADLFPKILDKINISSDNLIKISNRQTTIKTRVLAHNQQVVRIDRETSDSINSDEAEQVWTSLEKLIEQVEIIIVSDYAKGLLTEELLSRLITYAKDNAKFVLVDPKGKDYTKYRGANLLTPNKREAAEACNSEENTKDLVEKAGRDLIAKYELNSVLITQGEEGMTLFEKNFEPTHFSALARNVYDVTGAGDTVISTLAVALGAGKSLTEASELANIAAGLVVEKIGTTAITFEELEEAVRDI